MAKAARTGSKSSKKPVKQAHKRRDDIVAILLISAGFLLAISVLSQSAGLLGRYGDLGLRYLVGTGRFILPFALLAWGAIVLLKGTSAKLPVAGVGLFFAALIITFQLRAPEFSFFVVETVSSHGGYVGAVLAWPLLKLVGHVGAYVVVGAMGLIGLILSTGFSLTERIQEWNDERKETMRDRKVRQARKARGAPVAPGGPFETTREPGAGSRAGKASKSSLGDAPTQVEPVFEMNTVIADQAEIIDGAVVHQLPEGNGNGGGASKRGKKETPAEAAERKRTAAELDSAVSAIESENFKLPPMQLLELSPPGTEVSKKELNEGIAILEQTLRDFDVEAKVNRVIKGPTVTRFELTIGSGIKVQKISSLSDNLAMALAARDIRILAPIPGKSAVGIEVPNKKKDLVCLGDILRSAEAQAAKSPITFAIGKDIAGKPVLADLAQMPHLLIAGATGSGKSVMTNSLIISILTRARPSEVRMILIDPKLVELTQYNHLPHLLTPVISHPKRAANALSWAVGQMEERYQALFEAGVRNITAYNEWLAKEDPTAMPMPYIVIVIDELADLMIAAAKDVEDAICRLTQMARACGIHLVVATQRPSVDVITGLIKANIPSRISFAVASTTDSRVILDSGGAEKLVGEGDMLFMTPATLRPERNQGAFVSDKEVEEITEFIKAQGGPQYQPEVIQDTRGEAGEVADITDPLFGDAVEVVLQTGQASVSYLQRRLSVGYTRAGRLMDILEARGIVGGYEGSKPREVLITREDWEQMSISQNQG